jgi:hypothetical protein
MATQKLVDYIVGLTADTGPSSDDLIITVNDPGGTPANRKVTIADLFQNIPGAKVTSGQLLLPDGSAAAPSLAFTNGTTTGLFFVTGGNLDFVANGIDIARMNAAGIFTTGYIGLGASFADDVQLWRGAADILELRRGANAQKFNWYATYTDASNYEGGYLTAAAGSVTLGARTAGTGSDNIDLLLLPAGTGNVKFGTYAAKGAEAFDGYITIKDAAGNARKIMTCA